MEQPKLRWTTYVVGQNLGEYEHQKENRNIAVVYRDQALFGFISGCRLNLLSYGRARLTAEFL